MTPPLPTLKLRYTSISTIGGRSRQEDAHVAFVPPQPRPSTYLDVAGVFAVADGLGGHDNGHLASRAACEALLDWPSAGSHYSDIFAASHRAARETGGQTTLMVCAVERTALDGTPQWAAWFAGAGDCTAMVLRDTHADLKPKGLSSRYTRVFLTNRHGMYNRVTKCLGGYGRDGEADAIPEVVSFNVRPGDKILIVSDGFDEALGLDNNDPLNAIESYRMLFRRPGAIGLKELEHFTRLCGSNDNATAILVDVGVTAPKTVKAKATKAPARRKRGTR